MTTVNAEHLPPSAGRPGAALTADALSAALWGMVAALGDRRERVVDGRRTPSRTLTPRLEAVASDLLGAVLRRVDLNAVLDRLDVQRVVDRIDVARALRGVDLDELAARVNLDALLDRVDVDELMRRVDLAAVAREALGEVDIGDAVQAATATPGSHTADDRSAGAGIHGLVGRVVGRVLHGSASGGTAPGRDGGA